jgi:hypothetical protein
LSKQVTEYCVIIIQATAKFTKELYRKLKAAFIWLFEFIKKVTRAIDGITPSKGRGRVALGRRAGMPTPERLPPGVTFRPGIQPGRPSVPEVTPPTPSRPIIQPKVGPVFRPGGRPGGPSGVRPVTAPPTAAPSSRPVIQPKVGPV